METQSPTPASSETPEPYYGFHFPETDGDVTLMDRVSPYPPEFVETYFKSEYCLITNAVYPMRVYQPCTDLLPRTMSWLAAGVPTDFMDRVSANLDRWEDDIPEDEAIERANLGEHGMAQVPDPGERIPAWELPDAETRYSR